jgi:hypothetical protein
MIRFALLAIAFLIGGWLVFDGARALVVGDYITPRAGDAAGQLGPWSRVISAVGFEPRSRLIKWVHVVLGALWLCAGGWFFINGSSGGVGLIVMSVCTLWYLPIGTVLSLAEMVLLFFWSRPHA